MKTTEEFFVASGERWQKRKKEREKNIKGIKENKIFEVETPERIQKRLNHLADFKKEATLKKSLKPGASRLIDEIGLERVIGDRDFLGVSFLEHALAVSRSVCKVNIYKRPGILAGSGTGFMVSPSLVMTNNHVLTESRIAMNSNVQFNHQLDVKGNILPAAFFTLDPDRFFVTNADLDYTLVAVSPESRNQVPLESFGWNKLKGEGKALIGDHLNIIQHPSGDFKKIVLQSNELIDLLPFHAHYLGDTEPGSSGALVCNNQLEVVVLHHSSVPEIVNGKVMDIQGNPWDGVDYSTIHWIANEGIRISRILANLEKQELPVLWEALRKELFEAIPPNPIELYIESKTVKKKYGQGGSQATGDVTWTIPLKITVSIDGIIKDGEPKSVIPEVDEAPSSVADKPVDDTALEKTKVPVIDPDYTSRTGYDEDFLGVNIPVPTLQKEDKVSKMDNGESVLPYHHFSVVMNKERRMAYFCVSNVDGREDMKEPEQGRNYSRKGLGGLDDNDREAWLTDPRIPEAHQLPDKFYNRDRKSFDKGHIVRRDDVAWGRDYDEVRFANGDTFHSTNCSPQVADYNRSNLRGIWGRFENHLLREAEDERLVVFSGPVFRDSDRNFEGRDHRGHIEVKIPKAFWKVVVSRSGQSVKTFTFMFDQDLSDVDWDEVFAVTRDYKRFQKKLTELERELGYLTFPDILKDTDQMKNA